MKRAFLPVGLIVALAMALMIPEPGIHAKNSGLIPIFIAIIFLVNGFQLKLRVDSFDGKLIAAFLAASGVSLILGPWLGVLAAHIFGTSPVMTIGLVVMASVPVTLSSAVVMVDICGGNRLWALLMTVGMNLCGIFSIPFMLAMCLNESGPIQISAFALLVQLLQIVLLPLLLGWGLQRPLRSIAGNQLLAIIPSLCVILTVYASFAAAREIILGLGLIDFLPVFGGALGIHMILLLLALLIGFSLRMEQPERYTLLFVTSQKTMPVAVAVVALIAPDSAAALIPCLVFHFLQLMLDSSIAAHLAHPQARKVL